MTVWLIWRGILAGWLLFGRSTVRSTFSQGLGEETQSIVLFGFAGRKYTGGPEAHELILCRDRCLVCRLADTEGRAE